MKPIFIIDDDPLMAKCVGLSCRKAHLKNIYLQTAHPKKEDRGGANCESHSRVAHSGDPSGESTIPPIKIFANAIEAIAALDDDLPGLIFLDVLLTGPNGFTFLNEIASYSETSKIPIILMSSLDLTNFNLMHYNIKQIFQKETMTPDQIIKAVEEFYA